MPDYAEKIQGIAKRILLSVALFQIFLGIFKYVFTAAVAKNDWSLQRYWDAMLTPSLAIGILLLGSSLVSKNVAINSEISENVIILLVTTLIVVIVDSVCTRKWI